VKNFVCYRPSPPDSYQASGAANPPDVPQFEGTVFSDGTVCIRWLTEHRSHSIWQSWNAAMAIHGHPEYGTKIVFSDEWDA
jgi:hypothetical protein